MNIDILDVESSKYSEILKGINHDIYHLPLYILTEARRIEAQSSAILISKGSKYFLLPYLLRRCPEEILNLEPQILNKDCYDVVSPYGYPGILLNDEAQADFNFLKEAIKMLATTFRSHQICSAFIRLHPILNVEIKEGFDGTEIVKNGTTVAINLTLSDDEQRGQIKAGRRTRINQCRKRNFFVKISPFSSEHISIFMDIYKDTMDRLSASQSYYFDRSYYESLVQLYPNVFICLIEFEQRPVCAGLFTECCGTVQYHLSGTMIHALYLTPSTLMVDEMRRWATSRGNKVFHLGGGLGGQQDGLFEFKSSFSKQIYDFSTLRLITDSKVYKNLVEIRAQQLNVDPDALLSSSFFPAYRAKEI
jgi:hypothetical protein